MAQGRDLHDVIQNGFSSDLSPEGHSEGGQVTLRIEEVLPWLVSAAAAGVAWLDDFRDEEISLSQDLHDVILAYQHFHRD